MKLKERIVADEILNNIQLKNMEETINVFNDLYRYTGSVQGEQGASYLKSKLDEYGISNKMYTYDAYLSLPLEASVKIISPDTKILRAIADVFSGEAKEVEGELYYDAYSARKDLTDREEQLRFAAVKNKVVLTHFASDVAYKYFCAGALAVLHISNTPGGYIHHKGIGTIWGNPSSEDLYKHTYIPSAGISYEDGIYLQEMLKRNVVQVQINIKMENSIKTSHMPVATIAGKSEKYVLISCHYDSWYEGITDNATSDAIALELARVIKQHKIQLERTMKFAWWSGHSDGRYAGSAWFCDNEWMDLNKNCVGHINIDLAGCKCADQIRARTTAMEGFAFTADLIEEFTNKRPIDYIPMVRGADESFMGVNVPISIMLKYEPLPENRVSSCPSGGPWWHTDQDTIDKLDTNILMRDAKINGVMAILLANTLHLPVQPIYFVGEMEKFLEKIATQLNDDFKILDVQKAVKDFKLELVKRCLDNYSEDIIKKICGELIRVTYTRASRYYQDPAVVELPFPGLREACNLSETESEPCHYLAVKTTFKRQSNRIIHQLDELKNIMVKEDKDEKRNTMG